MDHVSTPDLKTKTTEMKNNLMLLFISFTSVLSLFPFLCRSLSLSLSLSVIKFVAHSPTPLRPLGPLASKQATNKWNFHYPVFFLCTSQYKDGLNNTNYGLWYCWYASFDRRKIHCFKWAKSVSELLCQWWDELPIDQSLFALEQSNFTCQMHWNLFFTSKWYHGCKHVLSVSRKW